MQKLFKIGDTVKLKSGSTTMTISRDRIGEDFELGYTFDGKYECSWFEDDELKFGTFDQDMLCPD